MNSALHPSLAEAMRLTRSGKLAEATGLIRAMLGGEPSAPVPASVGAVIDLVPERAAAFPAAAGTFVERRHAGPAGTLDYRLYLPPGAAAGMPLVVMLHGCTQDPEDFDRGTGMSRLAGELGVIVAYPRQTQRANPQKCWNWFRPGDQRRDEGEPALLAGVTRQVLADHGADRRRVYVAGLSAGGAAAAVMADCYPDLFAAVGIHSGLACGTAHDVASAMMAMRSGGGGTATAAARPGRFVPVITFHGDRDATVHEGNSGRIVAAATVAAGGALSTRTESGLSGGGRRYTRAVGADADGRVLVEQWTVHGAGHAWSGGDSSGSYTDPAGPDASREMLRFFLGHRLDEPSVPPAPPAGSGPDIARRAPGR